MAGVFPGADGGVGSCSLNSRAQRHEDPRAPMLGGEGKYFHFFPLLSLFPVIFVSVQSMGLQRVRHD